MKIKLKEYIRTQITVSDSELEHITSHFHALNPLKYEVLVRDGERHQRIFFVLDGCIRIYFIKEDGQDVTRYLAFENQFATALVSFITNELSVEFVEAVEDSKLLYISRSDFFQLLDEVPQWEKFYRKYLEKAYINNTNRLQSFITLDATERYKQLLEQSPTVVRRLPNKLVANYLNLSQETLSRLKSKI